MGGGKRDAQAAADEHHDDPVRAAAVGQVFGVAGEGEAGIVDDALVHRRGDDGVKRSIEAACEGSVEQGQHMGAIAGVERARRNGDGGGNVAHVQPAGLVRRRSVAAAEVDRDAEPGRTVAQHVDVAEDRQPAWQGMLRQGDAQVGPDSRGFACRQGEVGQIHGFFA